MYKISIITPAYNTEEYIAQTIESVLNQNFKDYEFIIIDDGSTDSTPEIIKKYASNNPRIKYIRKQNEGQGIARNYAITLAKGKYILYLDSDDWFCSNDCLKKLYDKMEEEDCDVLFFNYIRNWQESGRTFKTKFIEPFYSYFKGKSFRPIEAKGFIFETNGLPFRFFKKDFLLDNEINYSKLKFLEDSEFYLKAILCAKKISLLNEYIVNYRVHKASTTYKINENIQTMKEVFCLCENVFKNHKLDDSNEHLSSFIENRLKQLLNNFKRVNKSLKNDYYKMMKPIFKYINKNYKNIHIKDNLRKEAYRKVLKYNLYFYNMSMLTTRLKILLKTYV